MIPPLFILRKSWNPRAVRVSSPYAFFLVVVFFSWINFLKLKKVFIYLETFLVAQTVKRLPTMQEIWVQSLGWEDLLEKEMATHPSILVWKSHGWRSLVGYSPWGRKESDMTVIARCRVFVVEWDTWVLRVESEYPNQGLNLWFLTIGPPRKSLLVVLVLVDLGNKPFIHSDEVTIPLGIQNRGRYGPGLLGIQSPRTPFLHCALTPPLKQRSSRILLFWIYGMYMTHCIYDSLNEFRGSS